LSFPTRPLFAPEAFDWPNTPLAPARLELRLPLVSLVTLAFD
jgi:hypothetical protein